MVYVLLFSCMHAYIRTYGYLININNHACTCLLLLFEWRALGKFVFDFVESYKIQSTHCQVILTEIHISLNFVRLYYNYVCKLYIPSLVLLLLLAYLKWYQLC